MGPDWVFLCMERGLVGPTYIITCVSLRRYRVWICGTYMCVPMWIVDLCSCMCVPMRNVDLWVLMCVPMRNVDLWVQYRGSYVEYGLVGPCVCAPIYVGRGLVGPMSVPL